MCSSRLCRVGVWSSVSMTLLLVFLLKNLLHSAAAFSVLGEVLLTTCVTCTFIYGRCGQQPLLCMRSRSTLGREMTALSCLLDNNLPVCSPKGFSTRCV